MRGILEWSFALAIILVISQIIFFVFDILFPGQRDTLTVVLLVVLFLLVKGN